MATVYKAYHSATDRYVAVKVLPHQFVEEEDFLGRFQQEVKLIARLEHPNILPIYDAGESQGVPYLVMRYIEAGTLKARIRERDLSLGEIDHLFTGLAAALSHAHTHGIIHRDIKPSNVLVTDRDEVFLTDFGIAKILESTSYFTASGAITGTPAYMSPEQAQGLPLDIRSDIYSLGVVLYELIARRVPFEADTPMAVLLQHVQAPLPLPSEIRPETHPAVERVLLRALAKDRKERFESVDAMLAAWKTAEKGARSPTLSREAVSPADLSAATAASPESSEAGQTAPAPAAIPPPKPLTTTENAAQEPAEARPRRVPGWLIGLAAGVIGAAALVTLGIFLAFRLIPGTEPAGGATSIPAAQRTADNTPTSGTIIIEPVAPLPSIDGSEWRSWTAANTIYDLLAYDGKIYAAGPGGVTIYDPEMGNYERLTTADGLPDPYANALLVDADGDLWVGTDQGLVHFDEAAPVLYAEEEGLENSFITAIEPVGEVLAVGTFYAGEGTGLYFFDGQRWSRAPDFPSAPDDPDSLSSNVTVILNDERGGLWVGTLSGLGLFDGTSWVRFSTQNGLPGNEIYDLMIDQDGQLLVATDLGAAMFDGVGISEFENLNGISVYGIVQDLDGEYWFAGDGGIARYNPENGDWQTYNQESGDLTAYSYSKAERAEDGTLYFGSEDGGLAIFRDGSFERFFLPDAIEQAGTWWILPAPGGQLWFLEEYGSTLEVFDPGSGAWSPGPEVPCCMIPYAFDARGRLWGGGDTGLWIVEGSREINITEEDGLPDPNVWSLAFDENEWVWVGTEAGLAVVEEIDSSGTYSVTDVYTSTDTGLPSDLIRQVLIASDGSIWAGGDAGLSRLSDDGNWTRFSYGDPFTDNFYMVTGLAEDRQGAVWVSTSGDGVYRYSAGVWDHFVPTDRGVELPSFDVLSVREAPDGSIWFGTDNGAAVYNGETWARYGVEDGLVSPHINAIYIDERGDVWFATSGGVTRLTR